jgi:chromosome partitioning protein
MAIFAVINRKGGVGKSTVATHIASYLAGQGASVMLGDVDRQQSSRLWLNLRPASRPTIQGWTVDERNFARPPAGTRHIVLDTPSGFHGIGLMKVAMYADAILMPSSNSVFDRNAALECLHELRGVARIASGKCALACLGMRIDKRTQNARELERWAEENTLAYLGAIKAAQAYSRCMEQGLTLFDFPLEKSGDYLLEWAGVIGWINEVIHQTPVRTPETMVSGIDPRIRPVIADVPGFLRR